MENYNTKKNKTLVIIIVILILIPLIIFRNNISSFFTGTFNNKNVVSSLMANKKESSKVAEKNTSMVKIKPETPGALKFIDKIINAREISLNKERVIEETNIVRVKNKLPELKESKLLDVAAKKKLEDIFEKQYFEHVSPDGTGIEKVSQDAGYEYVLIGENLAMGTFKNEKTLVDAWMGSFGHRKNILKSNYTEIGVAVASGVFKGENVWVAVQHFGTPRSMCPKIDNKLAEVVAFNQEQIRKLDQDLRARLVKINTSGGYKGSHNQEDKIQKSEEYNNLVNYYNTLVDKVEKDTTIYNNQVKSFNECIKKYQD